MPPPARQVCDFGIAKFKEKTFLSTLHIQAGTPAYMAPEMFRASAVSEKCDVFSYGTLLWECLTGEVPWAKMVSPMQARTRGEEGAGSALFRIWVFQNMM